MAKPRGFAFSLVFLALAFLFLAPTGCRKLMLGEGTASAAKTRVTFILQTIQTAGQTTGTSMQTAICRWEKDKIAISDRDELGAASDAFDEWRQKGHIYPTLKSFEIVEPVEEKGEKDPPDTYYVKANIDGVPHRIRVPPNARISWADPEPH